MSIYYASSKKKLFLAIYTTKQLQDLKWKQFKTYDLKIKTVILLMLIKYNSIAAIIC